MSDKKVSFLVRKLAKDLGIKDYNEKNIETIFKNLLFQNAEYRKKNNAQIRQCVSDELYEFITNVSILFSAEPPYLCVHNIMSHGILC